MNTESSQLYSQSHKDQRWYDTRECPHETSLQGTPISQKKYTSSRHWHPIQIGTPAKAGRHGRLLHQPRPQQGHQRERHQGEGGGRSGAGRRAARVRCGSRRRRRRHEVLRPRGREGRGRNRCHEQHGDPGSHEFTTSRD
uniref:Uncharacterized protein n=1 Tax=Triticum urartu TaxID=4572 RepID=A0A8R7V3G4_TRIUA